MREKIIPMVKSIPTDNQNTSHNMSEQCNASELRSMDQRYVIGRMPLLEIDKP